MHQDNAQGLNRPTKNLDLSFGFEEQDYGKQEAITLTQSAFLDFFDSIQKGLSDSNLGFYVIVVRASFVTSPPAHCTDLISQGMLRDGSTRESAQLNNILLAVKSLQDQYLGVMEQRDQDMVRCSLILSLRLSSEVVWDSKNTKLGTELLSNLSFRHDLRTQSDS